MVEFVSFRSLDGLLEEQPSYLVAEILFISIAAVLTIDAWFLQKEARFKALWLCTILLGWSTEFLSLYLKDLDNFQHAQASIMLINKREPLYMLCLYFFLFYCPVVITWHTKVDFLAGCVLSAISGSAMFSVVDIVGANHLWWEWHSDDPLYESRWLNVPAVSAMWILTQMSGLFIAFYLVDFILGTRNVQTFGIIIIIAIFASILGGVLLVVLSSILFWPLVMMSQIITALQWVILAYILSFAFLLYQMNKGKLRVHVPTLKLRTSIPALSGIAVCLVLMILAVATRNEHIRMSGLHQPYGLTEKECNLKESCFWGVFERSVYLCDTSNMPFHVCEPPMSGNQDEYTTCGKRDGSVLRRTLLIGYLVFNFMVLTLCLHKHEEKPPRKIL